MKVAFGKLCINSDSLNRVKLIWKITTASFNPLSLKGLTKSVIVRICLSARFEMMGVPPSLLGKWAEYVVVNFLLSFSAHGKYLVEVEDGNA